MKHALRSALLLALWTSPGFARGPGARLLPPVSPACISSPFGPRILPGRPDAGTFHYGVDLPAPVGAPIRAAADGTVIRVERGGPGGLQMLVRHPGFVAVYSHFGSIASGLTEAGRGVVVGEELGVVGMTGVTLGPHLYFGVFMGDRPVDPAPMLKLPACGTGVSVVTRERELLSKDGKILPTRAYDGGSLGRFLQAVAERRALRRRLAP
jgi:murein DD-endopeptidase MepM/ murein hydrolase activator NlpD